MTAATEATRQDRIERYIVLDALEILLTNLLDIARDPDYWTPGFEFALPDEADESNINLVGVADLLGALWPDDEQLQGREHLLASARSELLVAQVAARLAVAPKALTNLSCKFSGLAGEALAKAGKETTNA